MDIEKTLIVENCCIRIQMGHGVVRIINDLELWKLLGTDSYRHASLLADAVLKAYGQLFQQPLNISHASLVTEIWGHVYYEWLTLSVKHVVPIPYLRKKLKEMTSPSRIIDCGEKAVDSNRWLWDLLAPIKKGLFWLLPQHMEWTAAARYKVNEDDEGKRKK